jgi:hypothetical protein
LTTLLKRLSRRIPKDVFNGISSSKQWRKSILSPSGFAAGIEQIGWRKPWVVRVKRSTWQISHCELTPQTGMIQCRKHAKEVAVKTGKTELD